MDKINLQIIREAFGRVVYSHKTYEKNSEIEETKATCIKWVNLILLALGSGGLFWNLVENQTCILWISSIITFLGLALAIFQMSFNPEEKAYKYKQTAHQLWQVREKYICLIADIMNAKIKESEIRTKRDQMICDLDLIYKNALPETKKAYKQAQRALKQEEEFTFSTDEINKFLPKDLWLNSEDIDLSPNPQGNEQDA
jgi:hypothetical protein